MLLGVFAVAGLGRAAIALRPSSMKICARRDPTP
jgi:hypothetical protein